MEVNNLIIKTLCHEYKIKFTNKKENKKKMVFYDYDSFEDKITINKNNKQLKRSIFESIYYAYCSELGIKMNFPYMLLKMLIENKEWVENYIKEIDELKPTIVINGVNFIVEPTELKCIKEEVGENCVGYIDNSNCKIFVYNQLSPTELMFTLVHESLHGIYHTLDSKHTKNEELINKNTTILMHLLRENGDFVLNLLNRNDDEFINYIETSNIKRKRRN